MAKTVLCIVMIFKGKPLNALITTEGHLYILMHL